MQMGVKRRIRSYDNVSRSGLGVIYLNVLRSRARSNNGCSFGSTCIQDRKSRWCGNSCSWKCLWREELIASKWYLAILGYYRCVWYRVLDRTYGYAASIVSVAACFHLEYSSGWDSFLRKDQDSFGHCEAGLECALVGDTCIQDRMSQLRSMFLSWNVQSEIVWMLARKTIPYTSTTVLGSVIIGYSSGCNCIQDKMSWRQWRFCSWSCHSNQIRFFPWRQSRNDSCGAWSNSARWRWVEFMNIQGNTLR